MEAGILLNYIIATDKSWHVDYFISNRQGYQAIGR